MTAAETVKKPRNQAFFGSFRAKPTDRRCIKYCRNIEPSCGIGNFIGMLPQALSESKMYGIELDSISAQIAQQLYQKSSVLASPFEEAILPDSFFDAVVGNVPFGDFTGLEKDIVTAKANPKSIADTFVGMVVNGVPYSEKADAGQAIIDVCKTLPDTQIYPLGEYRGFKLSVHYEPFSHQHRVTIKGAISHEGVLGTDAIGNITRIDNVIDGFEQMLTTTKALRDTTETQLANAKEQLEKPFAKEDELKQKEARLRELNALLNVDKRENEMVDEEPDKRSEVPILSDMVRSDR